jgi:hypothetical protein
VKINITRRLINWTIIFQLAAAAGFAALSLLAAYTWFVKGHDIALGYVPQFYADYEANVPNWYSANVILFNAVLLGFIAWTKKQEADRFYKHWIGLALLFVYLSLDEIASIHTMLDKPTRTLLKTSGVFYLAWVIPYGIFVVVVGLSYILFLIKLPSKVRWRFVIAGGLYVFSALAMEMIESPIEEKYGIRNMVIGALASIEESLELVAMAYFNYALLSYMRESLDKLEVNFDGTNES